MHPVWMLLSIALVGFALRAGLRLRRARVGRGRRTPGMREAHLRLAKPAVVFVLVGFVGGPVSVWFLRGWSPFGTFHAWLGVVAALLFGTAALLGRRLERGGPGRPIDAHAVAGAVAFLLAAVAVVAGFVLLP